MLQTNDEIDLFLALNDPMAEGAYIAAKNAGREGDILFVGFDGLPTPDGGIRSVMDGRLSMTQVYPTGGTEAIESAYQLLVEGKELDKTLTLLLKSCPRIMQKNSLQNTADHRLPHR